MDHAPVAALDTTVDPSVAPTPPPAAPAAGRCPVAHDAVPAAPPAPDPAAARCPVPHGAAAAGAPAPADPDAAATCPIDHRARGPKINPNRTKADLVVRKVLRIRDRAPGENQATAYAAFQKSMMISATRCTLTYVVFPFLLPLLNFLRDWTPVIGVVIGSVALVADVFTIRRFFAIDHKYRWYFASIVFGIMCLLSVLLVQDWVALIDNLTA